MRKRVLVFIIGILLIGVSAYAGNGDFIIEGNAGIGNNITAPGARLEINTDAAATKGLILKGASSQSANLMEIQNSSGSSVMSIGNNGNISITTTDTPLLNGVITTNTVNNSALTPYGMTINDAGSGNGMDFRLGTLTYNHDGTALNADQILTNLSSVNLRSNNAGTTGISDIELARYWLRSSTNYKRTYNIDNYTGVNFVYSIYASTGGGSINITNFKGMAIPALGANTSTTNLIGLELGNQSSGTYNTNLQIGPGDSGNWSIYNNSSYKNYFAGNLGIGTTAPPTEKLEVNGGIKVADSLSSQCNASNAGIIKFASPNFLGCNGTDWVQLNN